MASIVKLTKNEFKLQKDALKRFKRYLPTLVMKKQLLQMEIGRVEAKIIQKSSEQAELLQRMASWIAVFGEEIDLVSLIKPQRVEMETGNIAGVEIPVFRDLVFQDLRWDLQAMPAWTDQGIRALKEMAIIDAELEVLAEQARLLAIELRITSQRVNLFEKVKIPEATENIRVINIALGDQQTAAVVRGKMAKNKLMGVNA